MSTNRAINTNRQGAGKPGKLIKLYARGKIGLLFPDDMQYTQAAEECFRRSLEICVKLNANSFAIMMRNRSASEQAIQELLDNCTLVDEVHLSPSLN